MSKLAAKLFEERKPETENYLPLISAVFGDGAFDPVLNDNAEFATKAQDALCAMGESSALECCSVTMQKSTSSTEDLRRRSVRPLPTISIC